VLNAEFPGKGVIWVGCGNVRRRITQGVTLKLIPGPQSTN
jgi:hypothetical protein